MIRMIDQASYLYYAAGIRKLETSISRIYGFVQCSRDLSLQNCTKCLQQNVVEYRSCCRGRQGGIILRPSCFIRWELYPFLGLFDNIRPRQKGKTMGPCFKFFLQLCSQFETNIFPRVRADGKSISTGAIVAIIVVPILLLALGVGLWKRRKAYKTKTTKSKFSHVLKT